MSTRMQSFLCALMAAHAGARLGDTCALTMVLQPAPAPVFQASRLTLVTPSLSSSLETLRRYEVILTTMRLEDKFFALPLVLESARLILFLRTAPPHYTTSPLRPSQTRPLLASDLDPPAPHRVCAPARQHRRVARTHHRVARNPWTNQPRLRTLLPSTAAVQGTQLPRTRPRAELDVDSSGAASTCEPMLGNAGAAPAPSLHMLMLLPHRNPPPPYSATSVRWGREPRREKRCSGGVPRPARTRHQRHKDHPRLDVFGSGSGAAPDTCADARTGIAASYGRAWIIERKAKECEQVGEAEGEKLIQAVWHVDSRGRQEIREEIGTKPSQSQGANAKAKADNIEVLAEVDIEGEAMEEEVHSEGAKDGERAIEPEASCVVDILLSFATLLNPAEGETKTTGRTEEREWHDLRDDDGESQFGMQCPYLAKSSIPKSLTPVQRCQAKGSKLSTLVNPDVALDTVGVKAPEIHKIFHTFYVENPSTMSMESTGNE
ncbi:hypothetical protein K438DRAFT_1934766 [Mycena galopus ATCC 62051]|nr:hypothetical protein K438DRAFT_1934766 [Mycena galopus ATCC 62051]